MSDKPKHTPGPWEEQDCKIVSRSSWLVKHDPKDGESGIPICVIELRGAMGGDDIQADSKLIAAAPELLEALKKLCGDHAEMSGYSSDIKGHTG